MELNVKLTIDFSPEAIALLTGLSGGEIAAPATTKKADKKKPAKPEETEDLADQEQDEAADDWDATEETEDAAEEEKVYTLAEIKKIGAPKMKSNQAAVKKLFAKYKIATINDLKPAKFAEFVADIQKVK